MISNTAPLKIGTPPHEQRLSRRFLGNLFPETPYEAKELKAYVKGASQFSYGRDEERKPMYWKVRQEYFYV
jgi:hypothetical protein